VFVFDMGISLVRSPRDVGNKTSVQFNEKSQNRTKLIFSQHLTETQHPPVFGLA
jgi:hypothetical protein